jgi:signal transduction histidine kinase
VALESRVTTVSKPVQLALYRIVQESLTNVVRHARATRATVTIIESADSYELVISDNGTGATSSTKPGEGGRGLLGMRERAELLGGTLDAGQGKHGGFEVRASIPIERHE